MSNGAEPPATEMKTYVAFADRVLSELEASMQSEHTVKRQKIQGGLASLKTETDLSAGNKVLCARFALGADDAAYMQSGLGVLWSTAGGGGGGDDKSEREALALAPTGLYQPDAVDGIRAGLIRAMRHKNANRKAQAPDTLVSVAKAVRVLLEMKLVDLALGTQDNKTALNTVGLIADQKTEKPSDETVKAFAEILKLMRTRLLHNNRKDGLAEQITTAIEQQVKTVRDQMEAAAKKVRAETETRETVLKAEINLIEADYDKLTDHFRGELLKKSTEIEQLQTEIQKGQTKVSSVTAELALANEDIKNKKEELLKQGQTKRSLQEEVTTLTTQLESEENAVRSLKAKLDTCKAEHLVKLSEYQGQVEAFKLDTRKLVANIKKCEAELKKTPLSVGTTQVLSSLMHGLAKRTSLLLRPFWSMGAYLPDDQVKHLCALQVLIFSSIVN
jgi:hypothetical protein